MIKSKIYSALVTSALQKTVGVNLIEIYYYRKELIFVYLNGKVTATGILV